MIKWRPQVFATILCVTLVTLVALFLGMEQAALTTIPIIGMVAMKLLEKE